MTGERATARLAGYAALLAVLATLLGALPSRADDARCEPEKVAAKYPGLAGHTFKIAISGDSKPISYRDPKNLDNLIGFAADEIRAAMACIGTKYEFQVAPFSGIIPAVSAGQADIATSMIYYTPERAQAMDFVLYMKGASGVVVRKDSTLSIHSLEDLCGLQAVALVGSLEVVKLNETSQACTGAHKAPIGIVSAPGRADGLQLLDNKRVDVYVGVGLVQGYDPSTYRFAFAYTTDLKVGIGVHKGDTELERALAEAIAVFYANGTERKIFETYEVDPALAIAPSIVLK